jgi:fermentation-respiration switch protein FrsA (DUF1100 family)
LKSKKIIAGASVVLSAFAVSDIILSHYLLNYTVARNSKSNNRVVKKKKKDAQEDFYIKNPSARSTHDLERSIGQTWHDTIPHEDVSVISYDGLKLCGELFTQSICNSDKYVILVHGYKSSSQSMYHYAYHYWQKGFNILLVDLRACGNSEGEDVGMGWLDRLDIIQWINLIANVNNNSKIILHGESMGAATVMMASGEDELPENVKAIIEDCGYTSVYDILHSEIGVRFGLPSFPIVNTASRLSNIRSDYNFKKASALKQVAKSKTPTLFIHGTGDEFVPFNMLEPLYEACSAPKERFIVENAEHCCSAFYDSNGYYNTVFNFIDKYM